MAQTKDGALKIAANKTGVTPDEYLSKISAGLKWCLLCKTWQSRSEFKKDRTRYDGLVPSCTESRNARARAKYTPKPRPKPGRIFVPFRDGDKAQARSRVNHLIKSGLLPRPNDLPCFDCEHIWNGGKNRHEYDHFLGYSPQHHESVQAVCGSCHHKREWARRRTAA